MQPRGKPAQSHGKQRKASVSPPPTAAPQGPAIAKRGSAPDIAELLPGSTSVPDRVRSIIQQTQFDGPIPHPEIFRQYGEVIPDAPERILQVFEADSQHARVIQMAALQAQRQDNRRVHWMAWTLVIAGFGMSYLFATMGKDWLAGIVLTSTIVGIVTGFMQNRGAAESSGKGKSPEE